MPKLQENTKFGDLSKIPFSEPSWYDSRNQSPYYKPTHVAWRSKMRDFVEDEIIPFGESVCRGGLAQLAVVPSVKLLRVAGRCWCDDAASNEYDAADDVTH